MGLVVRVRTTETPAPTTLELHDDDTGRTLRLKLASLLDIDADTILVKEGFPPKEIPLTPDATLPELNLAPHTLLTVSSNTTAPHQAAATTKMPTSKKKRPAAAASAAAPSAPRAPSSSPSGSNIATLSSFTDSANTRPRSSAAASSGSRKRKAKALQLGSEEGIGTSLAAAVASRKGATALAREDPAMAFFKHAAGAALEHHQEDVLANDRFKAALAGSFEVSESETVRSADGEVRHCDVRFKVGRAYKSEPFELLSLAEMRAVVRDVLASFDEAGNATGRELLKPFKMARVSPRVFWSMVHHLGGDVAAGLHQLLPDYDWSFLEERQRRASDKAEANARMAEEAKERRESNARKRRAAASAADFEVSAVAAAAADETTAAAPEETVAAPTSVVGSEEELDAAQLESVGERALRDGSEPDYAASCLQRALRMRIEEADGEEAAPLLAQAWFLHGCAQLARARALSARIIEGPTAAVAAQPSWDACQFEEASIGEGWVAEGHPVIGRRVRRFFALSGSCDGTVVGYLPPSEEEGGDDALWRLAHDDGDVEDVSEGELDDGLSAMNEDRTLAVEAELVLEAAWESLELAAGLYAQRPRSEMEQVLARKAIADAAMLNHQPERAREELMEAHALVSAARGQREPGTETTDLDKQVAEIEISLAIVHLQMGNSGGAIRHYRQALAALQLRKLQLQRRALDIQIASLSEGGGTLESANVDAAELEGITGIVQDLESRLAELEPSV